MAQIRSRLAPLQFGVDPVTAPAERGIAMPEEFQEYPKWVYPDGDASKGVKVHSPEEEDALSQSDEAPRRKPGRPRKGE
jgi:hypothetical protein